MTEGEGVVGRRPPLDTRVPERRAVTYDLSGFVWKQLRIQVRAKGRTVPGRALRHVPTRLTKSGAFLGKPVEHGLIAVAGPDADPLEATYTLTDLGRHAAEYGEFEGPAQREWKPPTPPPAAPEPEAAPAPKRRGKK